MKNMAFIGLISLGILMLLLNDQERNKETLSGLEPKVIETNDFIILDASLSNKMVMTKGPYMPYIETNVNTSAWYLQNHQGHIMGR